MRLDRRMLVRGAAALLPAALASRPAKAQSNQAQLNQKSAASPAYRATNAETSAGVTPTNYTYPPGNALRYGVLGDGTSDDTQALGNWLKVGGDLYLPLPTGSYYKISAALTPVSNTTITGAGYRSQIRQVTNNADVFIVNGISNVTIKDLGLYGPTGTAGSQGGVRCVEANDVTVERCQFQNFSFMCVVAQGTTSANNQRIKVRNCLFNNWNGSTMQNCSAVGFLDYSYDCEMVDCVSIGNGKSPDTAVLIQNTRGVVGSFSRGHLIQGNKFYNSGSYAICCYRVNLSGFVDQHRIIGNNIDTVSGLNAFGNAFGAGIYMQGTAQCTIQGNTIRNTNVSTTAETLAPAAIGINALHGDITVSGNTIDTPNWYGIMVVSSVAPIITGITQAKNAVVTTSTLGGAIPPTNPFQVGQPVYFFGVSGMTQINGLYAVVTATGGSSGAWTITLNINTSAFSAYTSGGYAVLAAHCAITGNTVINSTKTCVYVKDAGGVAISGNQLMANATGTARGILATPTSPNFNPQAKLEIVGNKLEAPASAPLEVAYYNDVTISANNVVSNVATGALVGMAVTNSNRVAIGGNTVNMGASTAVSLKLASTTYAIIDGNIFTNAGSANSVFSSSGTCTGSVVHRTNSFSGIIFTNSSSSCKVSYNTSSGSPAGGSGSAQLGDEAWNNVGATPLMWWCTAAGSPGKWTGLGIP